MAGGAGGGGPGRNANVVVVAVPGVTVKLSGELVSMRSALSSPIGGDVATGNTVAAVRGVFIIVEERQRGRR